MKVWMVEWIHPYDYGWIEKVFDTEEKAIKYIKNAKVQNVFGWYECHEDEVE